MKQNLQARLAQSRAAKGALAGVLVVGASAAFADDSGAVSAITAAQVAALAVVAALVGMKIAVWGAAFLGKFFGSK